MNKSIITLNLLWAAVASGTFYAGSVWHEGQGVDATPANRPKNTFSGGPLGGGGNNPGRAARSTDAVDEFLARHGIKEGVTLSAEDMGRAIGDALRETDPIKSQMLFGRLMAALTPENAAAALAMIRENTSGFESFRYMNMLAYAWGGVDPKAAMEKLGGTGDRGDRGGRMSEGIALTGWAAKDPAAAMAWLDAYKGEDKQGLTQSLINGLAKSDFAAALKLAGGLENKEERSRAAQTLAREMIRTGGVEGATGWLASLTDSTMKSGAFDTLVQQMMRTDKEQAAAFIRKNAGEPYAAGAAADLAASLSRKDVHQGLEFAATLTGSAQTRAYGEIVSRWMEQDNGAKAAEASEYVNKMPAGPARDAGAATIARQVSREDPAASVAWASSISDASQREELMVQAGRRYLRADPKAGATWLAQSGLSPEAQQQVTAPREERPPGAPGAPGAEAGGGFQRGGFGGGFGGGESRRPGGGRGR